MITSLLGVSGFLMKKTQADEWGVYRVNEEGFPYLMLPFKDIEEAVTVGRKIAVSFGMECKINRSDI